MKKILLTGGAGYIGTTLTELLLDQGYEVRVFDRFFFGKNLLGDLLNRDRLELVRGDVRDIKPEVFNNVDAVVELSGLSNDPSCDLDPALTRAVNLDGVLNVAREAKKAGVSRFVFSSSCSVYGSGGDQRALTEESPTRPVSLYAEMKVEGEKALYEMANDDFCVSFLRHATVYGLSRRMRFDLLINIMALCAFTNRKLYVLGGGKQWRPLVHVRDVARAFLHTLRADTSVIQREAFNVGSNDQNYQVVQVARMVRDVFPNTEVDIVPDDPDKRSYNCNFDKISRVLDYKASVSAYEGIVEVKQALERGQTEDALNTRTVRYYKYLLEAEKVLADIMLDGRVF